MPVKSVCGQMAEKAKRTGPIRRRLSGWDEKSQVRSVQTGRPEKNVARLSLDNSGPRTTFRSNPY